MWEHTEPAGWASMFKLGSPCPTAPPAFSCTFTQMKGTGHCRCQADSGHCQCHADSGHCQCQAHFTRFHLHCKHPAFCYARWSIQNAVALLWGITLAPLCQAELNNRNRCSLICTIYKNSYLITILQVTTKTIKHYSSSDPPQSLTSGGEWAGDN